MAVLWGLFIIETLVHMCTTPTKDIMEYRLLRDKDKVHN
jgi:hypothetical protein